MEWRLQIGIAAIVAVLGLFILLNPVSVTGLITGIIPWLLVGAGAIYVVGIFLRSRRRPVTMILPGLVGAFLIYAGLSMKLGDPASAGPVPLSLVFALMLFGSGAVKLVTAYPLKRSRYYAYLIGAGVFSVLMGLVILFNWSGIAAGFAGAVLGLELIADAIFLAALSLRDRDKEDAREQLGLDNKA